MAMNSSIHHGGPATVALAVHLKEGAGATGWQCGPTAWRGSGELKARHRSEAAYSSALVGTRDWFTSVLKGLGVNNTLCLNP